MNTNPLLDGRERARLSRVFPAPSSTGLGLCLGMTLLGCTTAHHAALGACDFTAKVRIESKACCSANKDGASLVANGESTAYASIDYDGCFLVTNVQWSIAGDSRGCSITPPSCAEKCSAVIKAGRQNGTITVQAVVEVYCYGAQPLTVTAPLELCGGEGSSGCSSCRHGPGGSGPFGSASFANENGPQIDWWLGSHDARKDSRYLSFRAETPRKADPDDLELPYGHSESPFGRPQVWVYPSSGTMQQIKVPQGLVAIGVENDHTFYLTNFYDQDVETNSSVGGFKAKTGATPFAVWTVENDGGDVNKLWVTERRGGSVQQQFKYTYDTGNARWSLSDADNLRTVESWKTVDGTRTDEYEQLKAGGLTVQRAHRVYTNLNSRQRLTQMIEGDGTVTNITSYLLYPEGHPNTGEVRRIEYPNGRWEIFEYDELNRVTRKYESWLDQAPPAGTNMPDPNYCKVTEYSYELVWGVDGINDDGTFNALMARKTVVKLPANGTSVEVSRLYRSQVSAAMMEERQCSVPEALWTDPGYLRTVHWYSTSGADEGRLSAVSHPDGTATLYTYTAGQDGSFSTTVQTGKPVAWEPPYAILEGTQTVTVQDSLGRVVEQTTWDLQPTALGIVLAQETYTYRDDLDPVGRSYERVDLASTNEVIYACCGIDYEVGPDGVKTYHLPDALKREIGTSTVVDVQGGTERTIQKTNLLDAAGRVLLTKRVGTNGVPILIEQFQYDALGRLIKHTNAAGGVTTYGEGLTQNKLCKTNTFPDGGTRFEEYYRDGRLKAVTGTAVEPARYEYGVTNDGGVYCAFTKEIKLDSSFNDTAEWTKTFTDAAGRSFKTLYADSTPDDESDNPFRQSWYHANGQIWKERDPDRAFTCHTYDHQGEPEHSVRILLATDGTYFGYPFEEMDYETFVWYAHDNLFVDRATRFERTALEAGAGQPDRTRIDTHVWPYDWDPASTILVSRRETSVSGLQTWQTTWRVAADDDTAAATHSQTAYDRPNRRRTVTVTAPDGTGTVSVYQDGRLASVTRTNSGGGQISQTTYGYDAQGRQNAITDARNGTTVLAYNDADQVVTSVMPALGNGEAPQVTVTAYDAMGRVTGVQHPDGNTTTNLYYLTGLLQKTSGSRTYPVEYTYDAQGRMKTMKTWQNGAATAITTWNYDPYRGWLNNKRYPDATTGEPSSVGPDYTYTPGARLKTRTWARLGTGNQPIITAYIYGFDDGEQDNDHDDVAAILYSNDPAGNHDTSFAYDRRGRRVSATRNGIITTFTYDDANELLTESYAGGTLNGLSVNSAYNNQLQRASLKMTNGTAELQSVAYGYDTAGRLETVTEGDYSATYAYHANSSLIDTVTFKNGQDTRLVTTRRYDRLNRLESISSVAYGSAATNLPISYAYQYNRANQRTRVGLADGAHWVYQYDALGQVISGKKYWSDGTPVAGQQFEYGFDDIGNRLATKAGGDERGAALRAAAYTPNRLNQYTQRTVPGGFDVLGIANVGAVIQVNSSTNGVYRRGEYFRKELAVDNSVAVWQGVTNTATLGQDQATETGNIFVPPTPETFGYDADGNLTNDGRWAYVWDAENRLVRMVSRTSTPTNSWRALNFSYDYQGRRISKTVSNWNGVAWVRTTDIRFLYDGWNLQAVLDAQSSILQSFVWGLDLSGSLEGAGGVGGLLKISNAQSPSGDYFPTYDGNGNVTELLDASDGGLAANYEYGPFGELIRANGPVAKANPLRFSTKYADDESDLLYYGYRYYSHSTGRWLSRDPVGEFLLLATRYGSPSVNPLFSFCLNDPVDHGDYLGLACWVFFKCVLSGEQARGLTRSCFYSCAEDTTVQRETRHPGMTSCEDLEAILPSPALARYTDTTLRCFECPKTTSTWQAYDESWRPITDCSRRKCLKELDDTLLKLKATCLLLKGPARVACNGTVTAIKTAGTLACDQCKKP